MKLFKVITILISLTLLTHCSMDSTRKVNLNLAETNGSLLSDYMPKPVMLGERFEAQLPAFLWNGIQYLRFSLKKEEKLLKLESNSTGNTISISVNQEHENSICLLQTCSSKER